MPYPHWEYFLAIESDLNRATRFVEFSPDNFGVYSIEFTHILLSSSSEVDVVAKALCNEVNPSSTHENINDYRKTIVSKFPRFSQTKVSVPRYGLALQPWEIWKNDEGNPGWWRSYNEVKHGRNIHYKKANLENALNAVAGLFCLVLFLYRKVNSSNRLVPVPQLLSCSHYKIPPNPSNLTTEDLMEIFR